MGHEAGNDRPLLSPQVHRLHVELLRVGVALDLHDLCHPQVDLAAEILGDLRRQAGLARAGPGASPTAAARVRRFLALLLRARRTGAQRIDLLVFKAREQQGGLLHLPDALEPPRSAQAIFPFPGSSPRCPRCRNVGAGKNCKVPHQVGEVPDQAGGRLWVLLDALPWLPVLELLVSN